MLTSLSIEAGAKQGLFYGYVKAILDNMKLKLTNIHLKIEDIGASIKNKAFSFGIRCDLIEYSYVTKKPDLKISSKVPQAPKSVPKLVLNNLSIYWTTMENYIIRPLNIKWLDTSVTITPLIVSLDIAIINDIKCLLQLITYHNQNLDNKLVYAHRPAYLETAQENPRQFWKFAIHNVLNIMRRKKINTDKGRRQYEMDKLVDMIVCKY
jgi:hypothetical protein